MPYNLLLLPLLGGFLFLHRTSAFRFRAQRLDGNRLLLESAIYGALLLFAARLVVLLVGKTAFGTWCGSVWWNYAPFPHSDSTAVAVLLAVCLPVAINRIMPAKRAKSWAIRKSGDGLTVLLNDANEKRRLVSLTLGNLKWYVGYVVELPNLKPQDPYLRLLPLISGYRDRDTLETHPTVHYGQVLEQLPGVDISIVLPVADIKSATQFDLDLYDDFFASSLPA